MDPSGKWVGSLITATHASKIGASFSAASLGLILEIFMLGQESIRASLRHPGMEADGWVERSLVSLEERGLTASAWVSDARYTRS